MRRGRRLRVVIDTNVFISALISEEGAPADVVRLAILGEVENFVSEEILEEVERVLRMPKILKRIGRERAGRAIDILRLTSTTVSPRIRVRAVESDPSDDKFLEVSLEAGADLLISGDRHLLELGEFRGVRILSPSDFLGLWSRLRLER